MPIVTYSETRLVKRHRGTMPIILTCPHDGTEQPPGVSERTESNNPAGCGSFNANRDINAGDIAERVAQRILDTPDFRRTWSSPGSIASSSTPTGRGRAPSSMPTPERSTTSTTAGSPRTFGNCSRRTTAVASSSTSTAPACSPKTLPISTSARPTGRRSAAGSRGIGSLPVTGFMACWPRCADRHPTRSAAPSSAIACRLPTRTHRRPDR